MKRTAETENAAVSAAALGAVQASEHQPHVYHNAIAAEANALAAKGWKLHPLRPGGKLPHWSGWPTRAAADASPWTAHPAANIGAVTGGGFFVLDVDCKDGAAGFASLEALQAMFGKLPDTLTARTASGGLHLYFASAEPVRNSAGKVGEGLDVRGAGGYVVVPPSVIDGRTYTWESLAPTAPAPEWLVQMALAAAPVRDRAEGEPSSIEATPELLADLRSGLAAIPADGRDEWIAAGAALRPLGDAGRELWVEWSATSPKHNPVTDPQVWGTIGHDSTGPAAIFAKAARFGWDNPAAPRRAAELFGRQPLPLGALAGPTLRPVPIDDVMGATVWPPEFIVNPLIPAGHLTLFGSHGGSGKSILALSIGAHVAAGKSWAGLTVQHRPVLFVSLEDAGEIVRYRLRKIIETHELDAAAVAARLTIVDGSTGLSALMTERAAFGVRELVPTATLAELRALVCDAGLIVIDNASDAYDGPENDRRQVRTFVHTLAELGRANNAGVMLLAHIDKAAARFGSQGNSYSGSSAWHNSARSRLALVDQRSGKQLVQEKLNLGAKAAPIRLAWSPSGVLFPDQSQSVEGDNDDAAVVLAAIKAAIADGVNVPTARSGPATAQRVLGNLPDLPRHLRGTNGRESFWAAVTTLQRSGRIVAEEYLNDSRHRRERFIAPVRQFAPVEELAQTSEQAQGARASAPVPCAGGTGDDARI